MERVVALMGHCSLFLFFKIVDFNCTGDAPIDDPPMEHKERPLIETPGVTASGEQTVRVELSYLEGRYSEQINEICALTVRRLPSRDDHSVVKVDLLVALAGGEGDCVAPDPALVRLEAAPSLASDVISPHIREIAIII